MEAQADQHSNFVMLRVFKQMRLFRTHHRASDCSIKKEEISGLKSSFNIVRHAASALCKYGLYGANAVRNHIASSFAQLLSFGMALL